MSATEGQRFLKKGTRMFLSIGDEQSNSGDAQLIELVNATLPWTLVHTFPDESSCHALIEYQGNIYAGTEDRNNDRGNIKVSTNDGVSFTLEHTIDHFTDWVSAFGIFGGELFAGERFGEPFGEIHGRTAGGTWTVRHTVTRGALIELMNFKEFSGFLYAGYRANSTDGIGAEILRTNNGTTWTTAFQFPSDRTDLGDIEVFQGKLYASLYNDTLTDIEVWESSDGTTWTVNHTFTDTVTRFPKQMATDGTNLFLGTISISSTTVHPIYVYDGTSWSLSVDVRNDLGITNSRIINALGYDPDNDKVYACASQVIGSGSEIAIIVCPTADSGTPGGGGIGGGGGGGGGGE
mgnify:CR=1 FL=1